jgi:hypothetical protein
MNIDAVKEFFAESRDEAISMASTHYGVAGAELEVRELPASLGISGLGSRSCFLVWIAGQENQQPVRRESRGGGQDGERGDGRRRDRDRDRGRGRGGRDRDRGDRGPRADGGGRDRGGDRGGADRRNDRGGDRGGRRDERRDERGDRPEGVDEARLEAIALEAAERVRRTGEPEILESMTAKERWVVHNFLKTVDGVTSASEGEGASKRVKVLPD